MRFKKTSFYITFYLLLFITAVNAQKYNSTIEGRVLDESTGSPLENVNVYISGTTWGAATNKLGYFEIKSIPAGTHELVASMIGYEPETKSIIVKDNATFSAEFKLREATYELGSVLVAAKSSEDWKLNYEIFKQRFLGETEFASECKIENPEYINFEWVTPNLLTATSAKQINVVNNALGYKISCQLVNFLWDKNSRQIILTIRPLFTELHDSTGALKIKWKANREAAYNGSLDQFLKSAVNDSLSQDGFRIFINSTPWIGNNYNHYLEHPLVRQDGNDFLMSFTDYLKVEYTINDPHHPQTSWIKLTTPQATLDKWGYPLEVNPFKVYGFWSQRGVADMLPKYFSSK